MRDHPASPRLVCDLISRRRLQQILGAIWLLEGLLQLQPSMFTTNLTNGIMQPLTQGQPGLVAAGLQAIITFTARHLVPVNAAIALVQLALGICLLAGWSTPPGMSEVTLDSWVRRGWAAGYQHPQARLRVVRADPAEAERLRALHHVPRGQHNRRPWLKNQAASMNTEREGSGRPLLV